MKNIMTLTDSYKLSHYNQYPNDVVKVYSYMEGRKADDKICFFGLQYYINNYLAQLDLGGDFNLGLIAGTASKHGLPFNIDGWGYIQELGYLPLEIKALPEGSIAKGREPLFTITNTDPKCSWLVNYVETLLMKVWYPINVATRSLEVREMLEEKWEETGCDIGGVDFAFHNFGDRGSSSVESALIGGLAHLQHFKGTDNFNTIWNGGVGYSIPATEHSTITSWGRENEFKAIENFYMSNLDKPIVACVMDSYNVYSAVSYVSDLRNDLAKEIAKDDTPIFVIRPDSGEPRDVVGKILMIMKNSFVPYTTNEKGYDTFKNYRILWGDGINMSTMSEILELTQNLGYAADNFAFGSGGWLMQQHDRDTHAFAIKCSAVELEDGTIRDVYKDPITDSGKISKKGIITNDRFVTVFKDGVSYYD